MEQVVDVGFSRLQWLASYAAPQCASAPANSRFTSNGRHWLVRGRGFRNFCRQYCLKVLFIISRNTHPDKTNNFSQQSDQNVYIVEVEMVHRCDTAPFARTDHSPVVLIDVGICWSMTQKTDNKLQMVRCAL